MSIIINLTDQQHENLIIGALEGGSNYWYHLTKNAVAIVNKLCPADKKDEPLSIRFWAAIKAGAVIPINDRENSKEELGEISLTSIEKGEQLLADKSPHHLADILSEDGDAITDDVWFQYCTLGEIVYG
jgi:hypothetical protein